MSSVAIGFGEPGAQTVPEMAERIAAFFDTARHEVLITTYDVKLSRLGDALADTLRALPKRGVTVRIVDHDDRESRRAPPLIPPPSSPREYVDALGLDVHPIASFMDLMHHKYVVVDRARVWTGSLNWTDDAFTLQENCVIGVDSPQLAAAFVANFEELWGRRDVKGSGKRIGPWVDGHFDGTPIRLRPFFCPGRGAKLAGEIASRVAATRRRVVVCSPVLTSSQILRAVRDVAVGGTVPVTGVVDGTQMRQVQRQWADRPAPSWKLAAFHELLRAAEIAGRRSIPWSPTSPHDYMHAKIIVCDDTTFVGSFNHSRSGEENAENVLQIESPVVAETMVNFINRTRTRYGPAEPAGLAEDR